MRSIGYYGVRIQTILGEKDAIASPLLLHIAELNSYVDKQVQAELHLAFDDHPEVTLYSYPGQQHDFAYEFGPLRSEGAVKLADQRTLAFIEANLRPNSKLTLSVVLLRSSIEHAESLIIEACDSRSSAGAEEEQAWGDNHLPPVVARPKPTRYPRRAHENSCSLTALAVQTSARAGAALSRLGGEGTGLRDFRNWHKTLP